MLLSASKLLVLLFLTNHASCWDSDQLEVFDVVDEVKDNFYELLNITKEATTKEVRSAFKRLSLVLHPDKNLEEDTSEKFRNLVSVYEVLRDENKRKYYDEVLVNGLPNWKSAMFYYRRVRKIGLLEGSLLVFFIVTIGQYLVSWSAYFEAKYNEGQMQSTKKQKRNAPIMPVYEIPKPSVFNTLPFQIPKLLFSAVISTPQLVLDAKDIIKEKVEDALAKEESEEEEVVPIEPKIRKRKQGFKIPEGPNFEIAPTISSNGTSQEQVVAPPVSGGFWTDDDLNDLVQLVKKYPGGTNRRWEVIAEAIGRSVPEVTFMANKLKNNPLRTAEEDTNAAEEDQKVKQKTKGGKLGAVQQSAEGEQSSWNQHQQRALEDALIKYPKGCLERWDRISDCVSEKTKEECMIRYKQLVELVKKNKAQ